MSDFTLKAPLVEKVAQWKLRLQRAYDSVHNIGSPFERQQRSHELIFNLRRELWQKSLPDLLALCSSVDAEKKIVGVS